MDTVEFLKEAIRMCKSYTSCTGCVLEHKCPTTSMETEASDKLVEIIEKWAKEHPKKTRQSEFLKLFPDVRRKDGVVDLHPCMIDTKNYPKDDYCATNSCNDCRKDYWLQEVE